MKVDLTKIYEGADLSGTTANVIYLPIVRAATLEKVSVRTDEPTVGNTVFQVRLNGAIIINTLTIASGASIGSVSGLSVALADGDEVDLHLISGNANAPITLNLGTEDGQSSGGGSSSPPTILSDDFAGALDADKWNTTDLTGISTVEGELVLSGTSSKQLMSQNLYNFNDTRISAKMISPASEPNVNTQLLAADADFSNYTIIAIAGGTVRMFAANAEVKAIPYDAPNHQYLRMVFRALTVTYQASADGVTWRTIHCTGIPYAAIENRRAMLRLGNDSGSSKTAKFDSFLMQTLTDV